MKVCEIVDAKAIESDLDNDLIEAVKGMAKRKAKAVRDCEKTLRKLKLAHKRFLEADTEDLELNEMEY